MIGAAIGLISFLAGFIIFRNVELPAFVSLSLIIVGVFLFFKTTYSRFDPKVTIYGCLAMLLVVGRYIITNLFLKKSPVLVSTILMLSSVLSLVFIGLCLYYMLKQMNKFIK